jgi:hypothetical protein
MKKILVYSVGVIILFYVGTCIYQVACISCTIPHINEYEYKGSVNSLFAALKKNSVQHPGMTVANTGTVGDKNSGYAYYMDINTKHKEHQMKFDIKVEPNDNGLRTNISLIGAFDITNNTGGYGKKADGMDTLLKIFNSKVLIPLRIKKINE